MAGRRLRPVEGDVCWFCKQPADTDSWMDLGELKSTLEPVYEGTHYILYHEPCAVYSNGANVSLTGMDDQTVLQFWLHGERCSGIGLKCQLCGLRGATTGCLHGPCQQFYHYPCARVRAFQGHLQFARGCRALACDKHLSLLPHPAEHQFQGMWMEGEGGWNGMYQHEADTSWHPMYEDHIADFQTRWQHLLTMVPLDQLKAQQQQQKKKHRRSSKAGRPSGDGGDSDPEFRVGRTGRGSHAGSKPKAGQQKQKQGPKEQQPQPQQHQPDAKDGFPSPRTQQRQQTHMPQRLGVPLEIAAAVSQGAGKHQPPLFPAEPGAHAANGREQVVLDYRSSDYSGSEQQQQEHSLLEPQLDTDALLQAAGFAATNSAAAHQQQEGSSVHMQAASEAPAGTLSGDQSAPAGAAPLVAAPGAAEARSGSNLKAGSHTARMATSDDADSATPQKQLARAAAADAPAGEDDTAGVAGADTDLAGQLAAGAHNAAVAAPASAALIRQVKPEPVVSPSSAADRLLGHRKPGAVRSVVTELPSRRTAPYSKEAAQAIKAAATSGTAAVEAFSRGGARPSIDAAAAGSNGAGHRDQSDSSMQEVGAGGSQMAASAGKAGGVAASYKHKPGEPRQRRYLDVNEYMATGRQLLSFEPDLEQRRRQQAAKQQPSLSSPPAANAAANLPAWLSHRGTDMFSWLQQQVGQQQPQQQAARSGQRGGGSRRLPDYRTVGQPGTAVNGSRAGLGSAGVRPAAGGFGSNGPPSQADDPLRRAADALAAAAASLGSGLDRGQKEQLLSAIQALADSKHGQAAPAARESSTQVLQSHRHSPLTSPAGQPLSSSTSGAGGSSESTLVPVVTELLRVLGSQLSDSQQQRQHSSALDTLHQQQRPGLKRPRSLDQYDGIEVANAAAAAAASAGYNALSSPLSLTAGGSAAGASQLLPQLPGYFGVVTSLAPLQPGELRAAGVTAHPNVVSLYVRQDFEKALTLQPWSIVIPPTELRKLRSSQIEPSHLASQLYQLLHASNVMNHHSTNATASGGRGPTGAMSASGGYAGLPQDYPVRFVRGDMVSGDDPRVQLRGDFKLEATQDIEPGTIIGPWRSYVMTQDDYDRLLRSVPGDWEPLLDAPARAHAWQELLLRWSLPVRVPFLNTDDPYGKALATDAPMLYFCALGYGNLTCLANDPVLDPRDAANNPDAARIADPNVELCIVLVNGLPLPIMISNREIKDKQEVYCSYGRVYWQMWNALRPEGPGVGQDGASAQRQWV